MDLDSDETGMSDYGPPPEAFLPSRPPRYSRVRVLLNLAAVALMAGAVAWMALGERGAVRPAAEDALRPEGSPARWQFEPAPVGNLCRGSGDVGGPLPRADTASEAPRLIDELPTESPIAKYVPTTAGPVQLEAHPLAEFPLHLPVDQQALVDAGAREAFHRGFTNPGAAGGYMVIAYAFPNTKTARAGVATAHRELLCEQGLDALSIPQRPEIWAAGTSVVPGSVQAWWVRGGRVIEVEFHAYRGGEGDLAEALTIIRSAWSWPPRPGPSSLA